MDTFLKNTYKVFVYGTLKRGYHNHYILENSKFVKDHTLSRKFLMLDSGAYPVLLNADIEYSGYPVGEVYEVDDETMARLDRLEAVGKLYDRKVVDGFFVYVGIASTWLPNIQDMGLIEPDGSGRLIWTPEDDEEDYDDWIGYKGNR